MLTIIALALGLLEPQAPAAPAAAAPSQVVQNPTTAPTVLATEWAETLKASVANNTIDTLMRGAMIEGGQASVAMLYRSKAETSALIHDHATEIYFILEGSGTITTGGTLQSPTQTDLTRLGAGISHSGTHVGGTSRHVGPHDIVMVPGGMPHRFSQLDGPIKYLVYRFDPSQKR